MYFPKNPLIAKFEGLNFLDTKTREVGVVSIRDKLHHIGSVIKVSVQELFPILSHDGEPTAPLLTG